jgi:hypothetical protein
VINTTNARETENGDKLQGKILTGDYQNIGVALLEKGQP